MGRPEGDLCGPCREVAVALVTACNHYRDACLDVFMARGGEHPEAPTVYQVEREVHPPGPWGDGSPSLLEVAGADGSVEQRVYPMFDACRVGQYGRQLFPCADPRPDIPVPPVR